MKLLIILLLVLSNNVNAGWVSNAIGSVAGGAAGAALTNLYTKEHGSDKNISVILSDEGQVLICKPRTYTYDVCAGEESPEKFVARNGFKKILKRGIVVIDNDIHILLIVQ